MLSSGNCLWKTRHCGFWFIPPANRVCVIWPLIWMSCIHYCFLDATSQYVAVNLAALFLNSHSSFGVVLISSLILWVYFKASATSSYKDKHSRDLIWHIYDNDFLMVLYSRHYRSLTAATHQNFQVGLSADSMFLAKYFNTKTHLHWGQVMIRLGTKSNVFKMDLGQHTECLVAAEIRHQMLGHEAQAVWQKKNPLTQTMLPLWIVHAFTVLKKKKVFCLWRKNDF